MNTWQIFSKLKPCIVPVSKLWMYADTNLYSSDMTRRRKFTGKTLLISGFTRIKEAITIIRINRELFGCCYFLSFVWLVVVVLCFGFFFLGFFGGIEVISPLLSLRWVLCGAYVVNKVRLEYLFWRKLYIHFFVEVTFRWVTTPCNIFFKSTEDFLIMIDSMINNMYISQWGEISILDKKIIFPNEQNHSVSKIFGSQALYIL